MNSNFLITLQSSLWSLNTAVIMIISNLSAIVIGRYSIKTRSIGPSIPILGLDGLGLPELIATTSLGHIIGAGIIIGLKSINIIA
uniref:Photosystem I reaction center subunit PsaK n=1 Tax=Caloglossa intermedia TaxID=100879 RepID=A0A1Z1M5X6_9FLOR|nr:photosystem I reaction center subunit X [Caloglossa intermedia]ARW61406.1 photosystem I reaction center subunit X [Caloglossa intermedia]